MVSICQGQYGATIKLMNGNTPGEVIQPATGTEEPTSQLPTPTPTETQGYFHPDSENAADPYAGTGRGSAMPQALQTDEVVAEWTASEFIDHQKSAAWFLVLAAITLIIGAVVYILSKEVLAPILIGVLAFLFGFGAARKPRELHYAITTSGIVIEDKLYAYQDLKSFSVIRDGAFESILLLPSKRWQPSLSLYIDPEEMDDITNGLGTFLPYEERVSGLADKFLSKIRF